MEKKSLRLFVLLVLVAGCGGVDPGHETEPGKTVYTSAVRKLTIESRGGGLVAPGQFVGCDPGISKYTVTVAGHVLDASFCDTKATPFAPKQLTRTLTASEWSALEPVLQKLIVDDGKSCGADKETIVLILTTMDGSFEYGDGFYGCNQPHDKPLITSDGLSGARQALYELAQK